MVADQPDNKFYLLRSSNVSNPVPGGSVHKVPSLLKQPPITIFVRVVAPQIMLPQPSIMHIIVQK